MIKKSNQGQTIFEYVALICIFAAALMASTVYITRAFQGRFRESADVFGQREQYQAGVTKETETDPSGFSVTSPITEIDACPEVVAQVNRYEAQAAELTNLANNLNQQAADLRNASENDVSGGDEVQGYARGLRLAADAARLILLFNLAEDLDAQAQLLEDQVGNAAAVKDQLLATSQSLISKAQERQAEADFNLRLANDLRAAHSACF